MQIRNKETDRLFKSVMRLKSIDECYDFFEDLCTVKELQDMVQRFDTAILLDKGTSYLKITEMNGSSTATISRVSKCLNYGNGGYKRAIERMKKDD